MATLVNVDNFARAESDRMFAPLSQQAGGVNRLLHHREPASIDDQARDPPAPRHALQQRDCRYLAGSDAHPP
jgi:hypothetical protein